jgi:hypothetical protein
MVPTRLDRTLRSLHASHLTWPPYLVPRCCIGSTLHQSSRLS